MELYFAQSSGLDSVIWAPVFALLGVLVTLFINYVMHERRIQVEWQRQIEQREFEAKKQAFVELVESMSVAMSFVNSIPDYDGMLPAETPFGNFSAKYNVIQLYANNDTIEHGMEFNKAFIKCYVEVLKSKAPVKKINHEIEEATSSIESYKAWNQSLGASNEHAALVQRNWKSIDELTKTVQQLNLDKYTITEHSRDVLFRGMKSHLHSQIRYLSLIRRDLGIGFDQERYERKMRDSLDEMLNYTSEVMNDVRGAKPAK